MTDAVLVLASDRVSRGERADATADRLRPLLDAAGVNLLRVDVVPDDVPALESALRAATADAGLVLTSGGTGVGPRDVTPEATRAVLDREVPGLGEAMRRASEGKAPGALLSRALAGTAGGSFVVNLPGSPSGAAECLELVLPAALHGLRLMGGTPGDCAPPEAG
jgi:molybdenum cofactor synthesis domain-containing protein